MQNRDVFSEDYYSFLQNLATVNSAVRRSGEKEELCTESVQLAVQFLFNTYYHVRRRHRSVMADWVAAIESLIQGCATTAHWLVSYLSSDGLKYLKPYLVEGRSRDVRQSFSQLLSVCLSSHLFHRGGAVHASNDVTTILTHLVEMLGSEVPDNVKNCGQYFWVLLKFAQGGAAQCGQRALRRRCRRWWSPSR